MSLHKILEEFKKIESNFGTDKEISNNYFEKMNMMGMTIYYTFTDIGDYRYLISFTDVGDKVFDVGFGANFKHMESIDFTDYINNDQTNSFNAMKVFGIIGHILSEFNKFTTVKSFRFAGDNDRHDKAYDRLIKSRSVQEFINNSNFEYNGKKVIKIFGVVDKNYHIFTNRRFK